MQTYFYDLSGGINQATSKTALGLETKKLYWTDSQNIEILNNNGIIRQKGNVLFAQVPNQEKIVAIHSLNAYTLFIATSLGHLYLYYTNTSTFLLLTKTITQNSKPKIINFLSGLIVGSENDALFFVKKDGTTELCNLKNSSDEDIKTNIFWAYKGRLWVGANSALYFSALGKYNDFTTSNDAGYINNFHTDTSKITALKNYKDYLAIYKENSVFLLSGSNPTDFQILPFADKGTASHSGVITVNNKQYFINQGIFSLEQAGLLSQIQLGEEISVNIKPEFENFDYTRFSEILILHYELKNQVWFFIPYKFSQNFHTIWIYNYLNKAWFKRVIPQNITTATVFNNKILTTDENGKIYQEDFGSTFNGEPIKFYWKSPFLASGNSNVRKTIEEFYFVIDENYDNNFNFSVFKNYDDTYQDDNEVIYSNDFNNMIWYSENLSSSTNFNWNTTDINSSSNWSMGTNSLQKAEISESNYSVQLCIEGDKSNQNAAIIGLEFKEIFLDE